MLDDGGEVDLDLGNYERYLNVTLGRENNITTGKIYREVIEKEVRRLHVLGRADSPVLMASSHRAASRRLPWQDGPGHPARYGRDPGLGGAGEQDPG